MLVPINTLDSTRLKSEFDGNGESKVALGKPFNFFPDSNSGVSLFQIASYMSYFANVLIMARFFFTLTVFFWGHFPSAPSIGSCVSLVFKAQTLPYVVSGL